jgi:hypothetical protein
MILLSVHLLTCLSLIFTGLAIHRGNNKTLSYLFPLILLSAIAGIALIYPYAIEIFVARYSGAIYEMEALTFRLTGPYWWVYYASIILPPLPGLALIPAVRKQPIVVALLALLGAVPSAFRIWQQIAFG